MTRHPSFVNSAHRVVTIRAGVGVYAAQWQHHHMFTAYTLHYCGRHFADGQYEDVSRLLYTTYSTWTEGMQI